MASLQAMPPLLIDQISLANFGYAWNSNGESLSRDGLYSSSALGKLFDIAVGKALATMLGEIPVATPDRNSLLPPNSDCVEVGDVRVIGGVRPQNFDVGYRPDGIRFAFDSKTLNDRKSVGKNWQNMVNDLATEATTVHSRFPYAVVALMVIIPIPCFGNHQQPIIDTLERLTGRRNIDDPLHMAEAISLVVWHPNDGTISTNVPSPLSNLRIERFSEQVGMSYVGRYKGLPPHAE